MLFKPIFLSLVFAALSNIGADTLAQQTDSATIYGQVFDSQGRPLQGAKVNISSATEGLNQVRTDQTGRYEFTNLSLGIYCVTVEFTGFVTEEECLRLRSAGRKLLDFGLEVGIHFTPQYPSKVLGEITQNDGQGLGDVVVRMINPFSQEVVATGRTNGSGEFELSVEVGGQYIVYAYKAGYRVSALGIDLDRWKEIKLVLHSKE